MLHGTMSTFFLILLWVKWPIFKTVFTPPLNISIFHENRLYHQLCDEVLTVIKGTEQMLVPYQKLYSFLITALVKPLLHLLHYLQLPFLLLLG